LLKAPDRLLRLAECFASQIRHPQCLACEIPTCHIGPFVAGPASVSLKLFATSNYWDWLNLYANEMKTETIQLRS
ncbi:hypothetical protein ACC791_36720, partial [Rhizobium ruizarguesonis]